MPFSYWPFPQQLPFSIDSGDWHLQWHWTDWMGTCLLILMLLVVFLAANAIIEGAPSLRVLDRISALIKTVFRYRPK
jgi:hypothetical protein